MVFIMMQFIHEQAYHVPTNKSVLTDNWVIEVVTFVLIEGCFTQQYTNLFGSRITL